MALSLSMHQPISSFETGIDLGDKQMFSPSCVQTVLVRLYGKENVVYDGEKRVLWLVHTSVHVTLPFRESEDGSEKATLFFDLIPASTNDQVILSSSWVYNAHLVDGFEKLMNEEIVRAMDSIYETCVAPKKTPWVAHCRRSVGDAIACPQPSTSLPPPAPEGRE